MKPKLREKIIAFKLLALPPGHLKKVPDDEALAVLAKYGYEEGENNGA